MTMTVFPVKQELKSPVNIDPTDHPPSTWPRGS